MVFCEGIYLSNIPVNGVIEFVNSISSIFLSIFSLIPIYVEINNNLCIKKASLFLCGIGSVLYHATMKNSWKLFDEIPMIMITTFTILNILENYKNKKYYIYLLTFYLFFVIWFDSTSTYEENNEIDILLFRILFVLPFIFLLIYYLIYYYQNSMKFIEDEKNIYKKTLLFGSLGTQQLT